MDIAKQCKMLVPLVKMQGNLLYTNRSDYITASVLPFGSYSVSPNFDLIIFISKGS